MVRLATISEMLELRPLNEQALLRAAQSKAGKTVFLSHSSKDNAILPTVILVLENHGGSVYVDDGDSRLPEKPCPETARILRATIDDCRKFVALVTPNSKSSRWIPWELGLGDGTKRHRNVALFPVTDVRHVESWSEQEYLGLYCRIVWGGLQGYDKDVWMVYDHEKNTATELREWIRG